MKKWEKDILKFKDGDDISLPVLRRFGRVSSFFGNLGGDRLEDYTYPESEYELDPEKVIKFIKRKVK